MSSQVEMSDQINLLKNIVAKRSQGKSIDPDDLLKDKGINSIIFISILVDIEMTFEIEIPSEELNVSNFETIRTISNMIDRIKASG